MEFIDGITVLSEESIKMPFGVLFILLLLSGFGLYACHMDFKRCGASIFALVGSIFFCLAIIVSLGLSFNTFDKHYQVLIDDSVSFTEFYEQYELIEQNGDIYTIRIKRE